MLLFVFYFVYSQRKNKKIKLHKRFFALFFQKE